MKQPTLLPLITGITLAFLLWAFMFSPLTAGLVNMWAVMTVAAVILLTWATSFGKWYRGVRLTPSMALLGVAIALLLWITFWIGDRLSSLLFTFARPEVNAIYSLKSSVSPLLLSALLLLIIGPAEEIFWRGYVQRRLSDRWGANIGFIAATAAYTLIHVTSLNFMLIMAALVAGTVWGLIYRLKPQWLSALIISHALWDAAVFVWFPI